MDHKAQTEGTPFSKPLKTEKTMKKTTLFILLLCAGTAFAATPDKKKQKTAKQQQPQPVQLITPSDSLSYAAGVAATRGLLEFIQNEYKVDTAYMAKFVEGFNDAIAHATEPEYAAFNAGATIAKMVNERIMPSTIKQFEGTDYNISQDLFIRGFVAAISGDKSIYTEETANTLYMNTTKAEKEKKEAAYKSANEEWLQQNATKEGVKITPSGLQYKVIKQGEGIVPKSTDKVTVKYKGTLIDGTEFDSSYKRTPDTNEFRADQVIKGWTEALTMMPAGSTWELYIPQELAYGSRPAGKIQPYSTLIFTVELVSVEQEKPAEEPVKEEPKVTDMIKLTPAQKIKK